MSVAQTILQQLGGSRFIAMTGAKNFHGSDDSLVFAIPRAPKNRANRVKITLNASDLYDVTFIRIHGSKVNTVSEHSNIYFDQLQELITQETGLYTHL